MKEGQEIPTLIARSGELLHKMFDPSRCLFSASSQMIGGNVKNDYSDTQRCIRYSINALAGIQAAQVHYELGFRFDQIVGEFLQIHRLNVRSIADKGLLLHVLARAGHPQAESVFREVCTLVGHREQLLKLNSQDLCWMLSGLVSYTLRAGKSDAEAVTQELQKVITGEFMNIGTGFPYFQLRMWRKSFVSFGAITYFLKALTEYATAFNEGDAEKVVRRAVQRLLELQGPQGEWPWLFNVNTMRIMDWYPVFSVHQDAMAMLFLLPAFNLGVAGCKAAIEKSYRWLFGHNCLGAQMLTREPFFIFRSIRRIEKAQRTIRFSRALINTLTGTSGSMDAKGHVAVNPECRSYHIGWILYAWADEQRFPEFSRLL